MVQCCQLPENDQVRDRCGLRNFEWLNRDDGAVGGDIEQPDDVWTRDTLQIVSSRVSSSTHVSGGCFLSPDVAILLMKTVLEWCKVDTAVL